MIEKIERPVIEGKGHSVTIRERRSIEISGVTAVDSFDEEMISLRLEVGRLTVEGIGLHIGELSLDTQRVTAEGEITALIYTEREEKGRGGLFRRR